MMPQVIFGCQELPLHNQPLSFVTTAALMLDGSPNGFEILRI